MLKFGTLVGSKTNTQQLTGFKCQISPYKRWNQTSRLKNEYTGACEARNVLPHLGLGHSHNHLELHFVLIYLKSKYTLVQLDVHVDSIRLDDCRFCENIIILNKILNLFECEILGDQ